MAALTQLRPYAGPGGRYGSFAGKEADAGVPPGPHTPGRITQLRPYAGPGGRYGSFAGKEGTEAPPAAAVSTPSGGWIYDPYRRRRRKRGDDDEPLPPPVTPPPLPERPRVDLAALDARIAALDERIKQARRGRVKLRQQLAALEAERVIAAAWERHMARLRDDDEWFLLS